MLFVIIAWMTIHFGRNPRNRGSPPRDNSDVNIMNYVYIFIIDFNLYIYIPASVV